MTVLRKVHAAGVLIENTIGEVLVIYRHQNESEGNTWGPVGGRIDNGETKKDAIIREIKEEINYDANESELEFLRTFKLKYPDKIVIFELFRLKVPESLVNLKLQTTEATKFMWKKPEILYKRKDLIQGLYQILAKIYKIT